MQNACPVGLLQCIGDLEPALQCLLEWKRSLLQSVVEGFAF